MRNQRYDLWVMLICLFLTFAIVISVSVTHRAEKTYQVIDKYESENKCYVIVPIEVTPEEYIGYDIGDEYEVSE